MVDQLADSIKRLREILRERYKMTNLTTQDVAHVEFQSAVHFPEAIQTINQLADLVVVMNEALRGSIGGSVGIEQLGNQRMIDNALTKAAPIAQLKEK